MHFSRKSGSELQGQRVQRLGTENSSVSTSAANIQIFCCISSPDFKNKWAEFQEKSVSSPTLQKIGTDIVIQFEDDKEIELCRIKTEESSTLKDRTWTIMIDKILSTFKNEDLSFLRSITKNEQVANILNAFLPMSENQEDNPLSYTLFLHQNHQTISIQRSNGLVKNNNDRCFKKELAQGKNVFIYPEEFQPICMTTKFICDNINSIKVTSEENSIPGMSSHTKFGLDYLDLNYHDNDKYEILLRYVCSSNRHVYYRSFTR
eukprot:GHVP01001966.1.p1 GENE.GHVP01001966.1~~GHVP01001966.1.p1  ORF type:complete len:262 (-),score=38.25 GHVP01001966.1:90-875(-)